MLIAPNQRETIARLLQFLEQGERLAHDCARAQAQLAGDGGMCRFLMGQARQEAAHSLVFRGAIAWLAPRRGSGAPALPSLERYRQLLDSAIAHGNFMETVVAEQVILEGLGEAILRRIEEGLAKRRAPLGRVRLMLLHQEEAHHQFGLRIVQRAVASGHTSLDRLRSQVQEYLFLSQDMLVAVADLFVSIDEDAALYLSYYRDTLPDWIKGHETAEEK
jgi:hypothetical protein